MKTTHENHDCLSGVIGQELAKERISYTLANAALGRNVRSVIFTGRTGLGKDHLTDATLDGFNKIGWKTHDFSRPGQILGAEYISLCEDIATAGLPVAIKIGEAHDLLKIKRVQLQRLHQFIMIFTDDRNIGKERYVNDGEIGGLVDHSRLIFILNTNFPGKLEEGRGSNSFLDRLNHCKLEDYTNPQIVTILHKMSNSAGVKIHENTIDLIAKCARGTARPLQNIITELAGMNMGKKDTINRDQVIRAIQLAQLYPLGLSVEEIGILVYCLTPTLQGSLNTLLPNMEPVAVRNSLAFLSRCGRDKDGHPASFIDRLSGGGFQTTPRGKKYMDDIKKDGFKLP